MRAFSCSATFIVVDSFQAFLVKFAICENVDSFCLCNVLLDVFVGFVQEKHLCQKNKFWKLILVANSDKIEMIKCDSL